jgi:hypothetical protein
MEKKFFLKTLKNFCPVAFVIGLIGLLVVIFKFNPADSGIYPPCPFRYLTGLHCPGCGSLRAVFQLLHVNLYAAFRQNPLMLLAIPFLVYSFLSRLRYSLGPKHSKPKFVKPIWIWLVLIIIILYGILRNLPFYPFMLLAPT